MGAARSEEAGGVSSGTPRSSWAFDYLAFEARARGNYVGLPHFAVGLGI